MFNVMDRERSRENKLKRDLRLLTQASRAALTAHNVPTVPETSLVPPLPLVPSVFASNSSLANRLYRTLTLASVTFRPYCVKRV